MLQVSRKRQWLDKHQEMDTHFVNIGFKKDDDIKMEIKGITHYIANNNPL